MKDFLKPLAWILGGLIALGVFSFGFSAYDYGWKCTTCLRDYHVVERQFFGLAYRKTSRLRFEGHNMSVLTGKPCEHVFRKGGFGRSFGGLFGGGIGCGITGEGLLFRSRWEALSYAFKLNEKLHEEKLLKETLEVVDAQIPSNATVSFYKTDSAYFSMQKLARLSNALRTATNSLDWEIALSDARMNSEQNADGNPH